MHLALKIILALLSTSALLCLTIYIFLANKGRSSLLHSTERASNPLSFGAKAFFILSAVALIICLYGGADIMLFWLLSSLGGANEDGVFVRLQGILVWSFTIFGGMAFIEFIDKSVHRQFYLHNRENDINDLEKVIDASRSEEDLHKIIEANKYNRYLVMQAEKLLRRSQSK